LLHPSADHGVRLVSCATARRPAHSPRRDHPSKNSPESPWALRSPGALASLMFLLDPSVPSPHRRFRRGGLGPYRRGCHLRGFFRRFGP
jgi:hypothetical protein